MPEAKLRLGMVKMGREQLDEAERFFREAAQVKDFALADFAELQRGQALFQKQKFGEAAKVFEDLPGKFPKSEYLAQSRLAAGKSRFRDAKYPEAERSLRQLLDNHKESPQIAEASYWLGQTLRELKRSADAVKLLEAAIAAPSAGEFKPQLEFARLEALADQPMQQAESLKHFADFAGRYPQHPLAADALYRAARGVGVGGHGFGPKTRRGVSCADRFRQPSAMGRSDFHFRRVRTFGRRAEISRRPKSSIGNLIAKLPDHPQSASGQSAGRPLLGSQPAARSGDWLAE